MRKTKIIATMGPACESESILEKMVKAGMNMARFNMSHGNHDSHKKHIDIVKKVRQKLGVSLPIMVDTRGPEIRIKQFKNGKAELEVGSTFVLTTRDIVGSAEGVSINYNSFPSVVGKGTRILLSDGLIELRVIDKNETDVLTRVMAGGTLSNNKSINVPDVNLNMEYLSEIDKSDMKFAKDMNAEFLAISFVSCKEDVLCVREYLNSINAQKLKIISKIENQKGVDNIDEIIEVSDGIMVARGDLGVEVPFERIPEYQKMIISKCNKAGKLVITATDMLDSMITNARPTRAEISDVANAILDGTCLVMLSGETSVGAHPVLVVDTMAKIAEMAENGIKPSLDYASVEKLHGNITKSVAFGACALALESDAKAILAVTKSGTTAMDISSFKPQIPILGCTPDENVYHTLGAYYGVVPVKQPEMNSIDILLSHARDMAVSKGLVSKGDVVIQTAGKETHISGSNVLMLNVIE